MDQKDGVLFDVDATRVERMREFDKYGGLRLWISSTIESARVALHVDIGFGDATEPPANWFDCPVLLDMPSPRLRGYARETVIAEKFQAIVELGMANSRMKDYFDLWMISQYFEIDESRLRRAISATFSRRDTPIPVGVPDGLSKAFAENASKRQQWESFKRDLNTDPGSLDDVVAALEAYLLPVALATRDGN